MEKFIVIIILFFLIFVSSCSDSKIEIVTENTLQGELISLGYKNENTWKIKNDNYGKNKSNSSIKACE